MLSDRMSSPQTPDAESAFARWLAMSDGGEAQSIDELCAEHPEHADALRALHAEHERQQVPPTIDVGAGDDGTEAWDSFLQQLRARGENWTRYADEGEVARGGMGAIRRVFDRDARRRLALKVRLERRTEGAPAESDASLGR